MTTLSIIVLSYNTKDYLKQTLSSIKKNKNWQIIVVDNNSKDGSAKMVEKKFSHVKLIHNQKNLGFAGGNNVGIKTAKGKYIMLLNSDTQIVDNALEDLITYLNNHQDVGAITPKFVLPNGSIDLACHRGFPTPWNALSYFLKLEQLFPNFNFFAGYHRTWEDFNTTHQVEVISAGAMMVRKEVIDTIGLLDERFFLYAEDIDWCKRIHDAGWKIIYHPKATIIHHKSKSGKTKEDLSAHQTKSVSKYHFFNTMKQYYDKHFTHHPKWLKKFVKFGIEFFSGGAKNKR